jgi:hypothetical protein
MLGEAGDKLDIFQAADQQKINWQSCDKVEGENRGQPGAQSL